MVLNRVYSGWRVYQCDTCGIEAKSAYPTPEDSEKLEYDKEC